MNLVEPRQGAAQAAPLRHGQRPRDAPAPGPDRADGPHRPARRTRLRRASAPRGPPARTPAQAGPVPGPRPLARRLRLRLQQEDQPRARLRARHRTLHPQSAKTSSWSANPVPGRATSPRPSDAPPSSRATASSTAKRTPSSKNSAEATLAETRKEYLAELARAHLLIIDDLGMRKLPHTAAEDLLELIHAPLRAGLDDAHLQPARRRVGQAARRHRRGHRAARPAPASRTRAQVRAAQLAHPGADHLGRVDGRRVTVGSRWRIRRFRTGPQSEPRGHVSSTRAPVAGVALASEGIRGLPPVGPALGSGAEDSRAAERQCPSGRGPRAREHRLQARLAQQPTPTVPTVVACARRAFRGTRVVARRNALSRSSSSTTPSGPARPLRLASVPRPGMTNTDVRLGTHPGARTGRGSITDRPLHRPFRYVTVWHGRVALTNAEAAGTLSRVAQGQRIPGPVPSSSGPEIAATAADREWSDALPVSLAGSATVELLEQVCRYLEAVELPRGFRRDG